MVGGGVCGVSMHKGWLQCCSTGLTGMHVGMYCCTPVQLVLWAAMGWLVSSSGCWLQVRGRLLWYVWFLSVRATSLGNCFQLTA